MTHNNPNRLLIVEDEPAIRNLYSVVIARHFPALSVDAVCDGIDAVDSFAKIHPATILMDSKMPVLDGVTACLHLQKICRLKDWELPKLIICTAAISPQDRQLIAGMDPVPSILAKPIHNRDLIDTLDETLHNVDRR